MIRTTLGYNAMRLGHNIAALTAALSLVLTYLQGDCDRRSPVSLHS